ncbi:MAG: hypothetical protein QNJ90_14545 [Planctomycetota bacterium]|nr:hypothetical protein [Planctomycetota bacterium]
MRMPALMLVLLLAAPGCGGDADAPPATPAFERFAFDSGGAHHIQGHGAWRVELLRGGKLVVAHDVRGKIKTYGPFDLTQREQDALWKVVAAADIENLRPDNRPGVPDESTYAFMVTTAKGETRAVVWQNDLPKHAALGPLLTSLRALIEARCGKPPVF